MLVFGLIEASDKKTSTSESILLRLVGASTPVKFTINHNGVKTLIKHSFVLNLQIGTNTYYVI